MQEVTDDLEALYQAEKASFAGRDRIHARSMEEIARIGRRAIQDGKAEEYPR